MKGEGYESLGWSLAAIRIFRALTPLGKVVVTKSMQVSLLIYPSSREWDINFLQPFLSTANWVGKTDWFGQQAGMVDIRSSRGIDGFNRGLLVRGIITYPMLDLSLRNYGKLFGNWRCHQRSVIFYGTRYTTPLPLKMLCLKDGLLLLNPVIFVSVKMKRLSIYFSSVRAWSPYGSMVL